MKKSHAIDLVTAAGRIPALAQTLADAFQDDPAFSWIIPDATKRRRVLPRFFTVMAEQSLRNGEVLASDQGEAASLWYPPGKVSDGLFTRLRDDLRLAGQFRGDLPRGLKLSGEIYAHHPKPQPYVHLRYVGVSPDAQGKGWGGAIIREGLDRAAQQGCGVLLETATPSNVVIYRRLGFDISEEWQASGGGPKFWTMIRPAD